VATLTWDQSGDRVYQTGIDRGVLFLHDGRVAPWNGLISIEEDTDSELKMYYFDGVKYLETLVPGDFSGKLKAFTYPEEFDSVSGLIDAVSGLIYHDQSPKSFNLSYRTRIGNDLEGNEYGYKIHILYNVFANPETRGFDTEQATIKPTEFTWKLSGTPVRPLDYRPTVHVSIDSLRTPPDVLQIVENMLYGSHLSNPSLPSVYDLAEIFGYLGALIIIDHGDGTWSAIDESNGYINMLAPDSFLIANADATFIDEETYTISSTNVD
jgi:hypothetical protein